MNPHTHTLEALGVEDPDAFLSMATTLAALGLTRDDLARIGQMVRRGELEVTNTPPPCELIPEGKENAEFLRVNGTVGAWWRVHDWAVMGAFSCPVEDVTSVEPVQVVPEGARVLGEDEVAVPQELVERARAFRGSFSSLAAEELVRDLGAVEGGEGQ